MKTKILTILLAALVFSCEKSKDQPVTGVKEIKISETTADIIQSDNVFGLTLFRKVVSGDMDTPNIFISPTSVALALAMTYNGADNETKIAMENTLGKQGLTADEINSGYKSLIDALISVDPKVLLEIANSIWYREGTTVLSDFITVNHQYYNAVVSPLNFDDTNAPDVINNWVSDATHQKITGIVDQIPAEVVMYLLNAIYFKGIWKYKFEESHTKDLPFNLLNGTVISVPMMQQTATFRYMSNDIMALIELPYGQGNFSMMVLLPKETKSTVDILDLLTPENWDRWMASLSENTVDLSLPRFSYDYKNTLNDELSALGMDIAFIDRADFSKINGTGDLYISKVLHKSFVDVNEEGTEAAAVTSVEVSFNSYPGLQNIEFNADHPFLFAIAEKSTGTILFLGRVGNPLL